MAVRTPGEIENGTALALNLTVQIGVFGVPDCQGFMYTARAENGSFPVRRERCCLRRSLLGIMDPGLARGHVDDLVANQQFSAVGREAESHAMRMPFELGS